MTFEEFFKKKKIDLVQLKVAEPVLFAEFENHYAQMGEKSFDHTKKYWFNNLRRLYHTPEEVKVEKVKIENPLAEQTITESITEKVEASPAPKVGFTPRFKAGATKPASEATPETPKEERTSPAVVGVVTDNPVTEDNSAASEEAPKPKVGFTPRFKAGVTKPAEGPVAEQQAKEETPSVAEEAPKPKVGFTPRFKAGVTKPVETPVNPEPAPEVKPEEPATKQEEVSAPKLGFKPKFKAGITKPKQEGEE